MRAMEKQFKCIKDLVMNESGNVAFKKGKSYPGRLTSTDFYHLTSERDPDHGMSLGFMNEHFDMATEKEFPDKWQINLKELDQKQKEVVREFYTSQLHTSGHKTNAYKNWNTSLRSYNDSGQWILDTSKYLRATFSQNYQQYPEITFEEFQSNVLGELPKKWCVAVTEENRSVIENWRTNDKINSDGGYVMYQGYYERNPTKRGYWTFDKPTDVTEITFEQFKKYVLKQETKTETKMEKTIIGWKLTKEKYDTAAKKIAQTSEWFGNKYDLQTGSESERYLKEAGVLDLWFKPVYGEVVYKTGDWITATHAADFTRGCQAIGGGTYQVIDAPNGRHGNGLMDNEDGFFVKKGQEIWKINGVFRAATPEEIKNANVPNVVIKGKTAEFMAGSVKFGCQTYSEEFVFELSRVLYLNDFKINDHNGDSLNAKINELVKYFEK